MDFNEQEEGMTEKEWLEQFREIDYSDEANETNNNRETEMIEKVKNKKTGKVAVVCTDYTEQYVIKYLKNGKPFGPLRLVNKDNFEIIKGG